MLFAKITQLEYKPSSDSQSDSKASAYFQPLYFTGGKTKGREVASELWAQVRIRSQGVGGPCL